MSDYVIVSFFTKNTPYESLIQDRLGKSLTNFNLPYALYAMESQGSWKANVALKPQVILMAMKDWPDKNVVFIDADAELLAEPTLFDEIPVTYDLAVHYLEWSTWYQNGSDRKELLSGTMFFRNSEHNRKLIRRWLIDAQASGEVEQRCLEAILHKEREAYSVYALPLEYCYLNSLPNGDAPLVKVDSPVIVHYQASRTLRRKIT